MKYLSPADAFCLAIIAQSSDCVRQKALIEKLSIDTKPIAKAIIGQSITDNPSRITADAILLWAKTNKL